jgi:ribosome-associated translation inhibitor RaiA
MTEIQVRADSRIDDASRVREYAKDKVAAILRLASVPILSARVTLDHAPDPSIAGPVSARVEVDLNGTVVRAHAEARSEFEAIDLMQHRLRTRFERTKRR